MAEWSEVNRKLEQYLRPRTFPLAFKLLETEEEMEGIPRLRRPNWRGTLCQFITVSRTFGWTLGVTEENLALENCASIVGFAPPPRNFREGIAMQDIWFKTLEDSRKHQEGLMRIPSGKYRAVALSPLGLGRLDPDIILIYGTPSQMIILIAGIQWENYEKLQFYCSGETACTDSIGQCYHSGKPSLTIPCYGERRFGGVLEDELVMALPGKGIEKILEGLEAVYRSGIRYPIPYFGCQTDPTSGLPPKYFEK
jgi:uncharacterized protein (DUF169 family)